MKKTMKSLAIALIAGIMAMSAFGCGNSGKNKDDSSATVKKFEDIKVESTDNRDAPLGETIVKEVSDGEKDIDDSYFQLPDDYTEVTYDEYYEMMYGDLGWDEDLEDTEV